MSDEQQRRDEPPTQKWPQGGYPFTVPAAEPHDGARDDAEAETVYDPRPPFTTPPEAGASAGSGPDPAASAPAPEPGSPEWYAAKAKEQAAFDAGTAESAPVTAVPGPSGHPGDSPSYGAGAPPILPPVPPIKQPMGAPTPVPPRIGRPAMPYGYTGQPAPAQPVRGYQLMLPYLKPIHSGPAIGGILAGSAGILAAIAVLCVGLATEPVFAVAFTVLAVFLAGTALALSFVGLRQVRSSGGEYDGKGAAITGMILGGAGLFLTVVAILFVAASSAGGDGGGPEQPHGPTHGVTQSASPR